MRDQKSLIGEQHFEKNVSVYQPLTVTAHPAAGKRELTWGQLFALLMRNRLLVLGIVFSVMLAVFIGTLFMQPEYEATTRLEIDPPGAESLSLHDSGNFAPPVHPEYLETQAQILRSDELAIEVIRGLNLDKNPDIAGVPNQKKSSFAHTVVQTIRGIIHPAESESPASMPAATSAVILTPSEAAALRSFQRHLSVTVMRNTDLVDVSFQQQSTAGGDVTNTVADRLLNGISRCG